MAMISSGGSTLHFNADLTPSTNNHCTADYVCTIAFELPAGKYTGRFSTYDGLLKGGNALKNPPSGNELSANQIAAGPDGALWFTESNANKIGRIDTLGSITELKIPQASAAPIAVTTGPDKSLWFTASGINAIGRVR